MDSVESGKTSVIERHLSWNRLLHNCEPSIRTDTAHVWISIDRDLFGELEADVTLDGLAEAAEAGGPIAQMIPKRKRF